MCDEKYWIEEFTGLIMLTCVFRYQLTCSKKIPGNRDSKFFIENIQTTWYNFHFKWIFYDARLPTLYPIGFLKPPPPHTNQPVAFCFYGISWWYFFSQPKCVCYVISRNAGVILPGKLILMRVFSNCRKKQFSEGKNWSALSSIFANSSDIFFYQFPGHFFDGFLCAAVYSIFSLKWTLGPKWYFCHHLNPEVSKRMVISNFLTW